MSSWTKLDISSWQTLVCRRWEFKAIKMLNLCAVLQSTFHLKCCKDRVMVKQLTGGHLEPSSMRCWSVSHHSTQKTESSFTRISNMQSQSLTMISWLLMQGTSALNFYTKTLTNVLEVEPQMLKKSKATLGLNALTGQKFLRKQSRLLTSLS